MKRKILIVCLMFFVVNFPSLDCGLSDWFRWLFGAHSSSSQLHVVPGLDDFHAQSDEEPETLSIDVEDELLTMAKVCFFKELRAQLLLAIFLSVKSDLIFKVVAGDCNASRFELVNEYGFDLLKFLPRYVSYIDMHLQHFDEIRYLDFVKTALPLILYVTRVLFCLNLHKSVLSGSDQPVLFLNDARYLCHLFSSYNCETGTLSGEKQPDLDLCACVLKLNKNMLQNAFGLGLSEDNWTKAEFICLSANVRLPSSWLVGPFQFKQLHDWFKKLFDEESFDADRIYNDLVYLDQMAVE